MKRLAILTAGAFAGKFIADQFVIRTGDGDGGFIDAGPGIGLDDFATAATIALVTWGLTKVLKG